MLAEIVKHFYPRLVDLRNYAGLLPPCPTPCSPLPLLVSGARSQAVSLTALSVFVSPLRWSLTISHQEDSTVSLRPTHQGVSPALRLCSTHADRTSHSLTHQKVFHKLRLWVSETEIRRVVDNTPGVIKPILCALREKVKDGAVQQAPLSTAACRTHGTLQCEDPPESEDSREDRPLSPDLSRSTLSYPHQPSGLKAGCLPFGQDPAGGCWEHLDPRPQQLLEEKEQAVAVLQEMVKVQ
ncbi:uncharacterized protein LOC115936560 [Leptonychotes weddellii]|uniref:Uncharacterized protein LOC115936560 n=1 Tax=Leptonychotes weddellii TaxID=9713 RepID=A0A7F8PUW9_LEPWE|nr:uncharacterized protein LOC115936560 [Leptonychotes weddellii]